MSVAFPIEPPVFVVRPWSSDDVDGCIRVGIDANAPVFASMRAIYGDDLFTRLRPDWEPGQAAAIEAWIADADSHGWVGELNGVVVGFIATTVDGATGMGSVEMVAVHPDHQRQGLGDGLLEAALAHQRASGTVYVQAFIRNFPGHDAARGLLTAHVFTRRVIQPTLLYFPIEHPGQPAATPAAVRRLEETDVETCVRFGVDAFRPVYASFETRYGPELSSRIEPDWERSQASYIKSAITEPEDETWVYELNGRAVGFIVLKMDEHDLADIEVLAVDPMVQGRGIATTLNQFALERSQEASMSYVIVATADDDGHAPARRSYENVGFVPMSIQWDLQITCLSPPLDDRAPDFVLTSKRQSRVRK